jgi:hypothetical protein
VDTSKNFYFIKEVWKVLGRVDGDLLDGVLTPLPDLEIVVDGRLAVVAAWSSRIAVGVPEEGEQAGEKGCQIFLGTNITKREKCTKSPQTIPNGHKYTK